MFKLGFIVEIREPILIVSDEEGLETEIDLPDRNPRFWKRMRLILENDSFVEFDPIRKLLYQGVE
ncbi:hypothetical protein [Carnobacterium maltaromaticum]|uniref:hypothetical protein n=1 Tax=Carnobacterium maltaromaticum TaxID=2751 RepID=UPI00295ED3E3|nr:hypothetical protein [Carnobacterium maltaromaticum]